PPAIFFYYSTLFDSRFKTLQQNPTINQFINKLDDYIHWYNNQRIKLSLGGLSPLQYRKKQRYIC
ncbi:IS3 family transposase, partial [Enterococcus faecium]|uniref:IS3 family transposase n=1 Tax=Enterococcus faecium TaxID=1352 RepID=UPI001E3BD9F7